MHEQTPFEKALGFSLEPKIKRIYGLCDYESLVKRQLTIEDFIQLAKKYQVTLVQYRNKVSALELQIQHLKRLKESLNLPIIINDKSELISYCDGLHVGQEDLEAIHPNKKLAVTLLRKKIGSKLLGLSTHNEVEILEANELDLDMIGLGAYRCTQTKDVSTLIGDKMSYLAKISKHPVCAIGGVRLDDEIDGVSFNVISSDLYRE